MAKVYVLHENAEWVVPLEAAFREQELPYELWFLEEGSIDLGALPPEGVFSLGLRPVRWAYGRERPTEVAQRLAEVPANPT